MLISRCLLHLIDFPDTDFPKFDVEIDKGDKQNRSDKRNTLVDRA